MEKWSKGQIGASLQFSMKCRNWNPFKGQIEQITASLQFSRKCKNWSPFKGRLHQCIQCNFPGNVEIGSSPFKGQIEQIAASLLAAQFSEELGIRIKIRKSTLNFQGNVEIENTEDKNLEIYT